MADQFALSPGVTPEQMAQAIADAIAALPAAATAFVANGAYMPVNTLLSTYPAGPAYMGQYARVNDLWGSVRTVMTCEYDGSLYYWRPQRTDYATRNSSTSGSVSLVPLLTSPQLTLNGTLLGAMTITPSITNAWPGAQFEIINNGVLGLFGINIAGLLGGTLPLLAGGRRVLTAVNNGGTMAWTGA